MTYAEKCARLVELDQLEIEARLNYDDALLKKIAHERAQHDTPGWGIEAYKEWKGQDYDGEFDTE